MIELIELKELNLFDAVGILTGRAKLWKTHELWRAAWSAVGTDDNYHQPLRCEECTGRLMGVNAAGTHWDSNSMTTDDVLAQDWEVRRHGNL